MTRAHFVLARFDEPVGAFGHNGVEEMLVCLF